MPTLAEMHSLVSTTIKRGTSQDTEIPGYVRRAARAIEMNYTFQHMKHFVSYFIDSSSGNPRAVSVPDGNRFKRIYFNRLVLSDGTYKKLTLIDPVNQIFTENGMPTEYWLAGFDAIWFNRTPVEDYNAEMYYASFTDWPSDTAASPDLLQIAEQLLLAETCISMGPLLRNPELMEQMKLLQDEQRNMLIRWQDDIDFGGDSGAMNYGRIYGDDTPSAES